MILNTVIIIASVLILIDRFHLSARKIFYKKETDKVAYRRCRVRRRIPPFTITSRYSQARSINGRPCRYQSKAAERQGRERKGQGAIKMYEMRCRKRERAEMKAGRASSRSRGRLFLDAIGIGSFFDERPIHIGRCGSRLFARRRKFHFLKVSLPDETLFVQVSLSDL